MPRFEFSKSLLNDIHSKFVLKGFDQPTEKCRLSKTIYLANGQFWCSQKFIEYLSRGVLVETKLGGGGGGTPNISRGG